MKRSLALKLFGPLFARQFYVAANEAETTEVMAANDAIAGTFTVLEGGKMIIPFAERAVMGSINGRPMRVLQRIDAEAGNAMRDDLGCWIKRKFVGRPIFVGHPYHPDAVEAAKWSDKSSHGTIKEISVANDRIEMEPAYNSIGREEVKDGRFLYHSPQWRLSPVIAANGRQEIKDGMPVFRPTSLHSAGLTNNPNLDVPSLVAANEAGAVDSTLVVSIKAALVKEGLVKEDDSDDVIIAAVGSLITNLAWARDAKQREADQCAAMAAVLPEAGNDYAGLVTAMIAANEALTTDHQTEITAANEALQAERAAHARAVVDPLIKAGKVKIHARAAAVSQLVMAANEAEFETVLKTLQAGPSKLQTSAALTAGLAAKGRASVMAANEQSSRKTQRTQLVHDCLAQVTKGRAARPGDQEIAWNMASRQNPDLFTH
jgi:hypothetical protein